MTLVLDELIRYWCSNVTVVSHISHSRQRGISNAWRDFITSGTNVLLGSCINLLEYRIDVHVNYSFTCWGEANKSKAISLVYFTETTVNQ